MNSRHDDEAISKNHENPTGFKLWQQRDSYAIIVHLARLR